ncbi:peptidoglycan editing factor PgeF [Sandarakinorhabdus oryzae]|uniref:peptidoglycan editing factor PgeF n=1 Tax=Sandarakinorhabdus oryzae TaxID=2675220 RepID=UPI0012E19A21|nr:peptidoglycan editing factor PgeF [Sandarakinorhabdus oryzae]
MPGETVAFLTVPALAGVRHGFLTRRGGVSHGLFASLNVGLGSSDDKGAVQENRRRAVEAVAPGAALVTLHQVHSATVVPVTAAFPDDARPHADAMVTATPGLALGILTADCAPLLFADAEAGVIGAAHSGWKGALADIGPATVAAMEQLGARRDRIVAAIGPTIAQRSYEVDQGFVDRFCAADPAHEGFFRPGKPGHAQFDLEGFIASRLAAAGVRAVVAMGVDTYPDDTRWFSFRRTTHRKELDYGRQLSVIALP